MKTKTLPSAAESAQLPALADRGAPDTEWFSPFRKDENSPFLWPDFGQLNWLYTGDPSEPSQKRVEITHEKGKRISIQFDKYVREACNAHPDLVAALLACRKQLRDLHSGHSDAWHTDEIDAVETADNLATEALKLCGLK